MDLIGTEIEHSGFICKHCGCTIYIISLRTDLETLVDRIIERCKNCGIEIDSKDIPWKTRPSVIVIDSK